MKWIDNKLVSEMMDRAHTSARKRTNHNLHETAEDPVQRYCIAATKESYFRPHRHPHNWEVAVILRGRFGFIVFDNDGRVLEHHTVGPNTEKNGFEIEENRWHCWLPLSDEGVFFEVKLGPYNPETAAEFAPWAPEEGATEAPAFLQQMRALFENE
ncbi:MAG: WbuC family cupin fold metalloprotein [Pontiella sp.]